VSVVELDIPTFDTASADASLGSLLPSVSFLEPLSATTFSAPTTEEILSTIDVVDVDVDNDVADVEEDVTESTDDVLDGDATPFDEDLENPNIPRSPPLEAVGDFSAPDAPEVGVNVFEDSAVGEEVVVAVVAAVLLSTPPHLEAATVGTVVADV
jgi:hypothetical protein